MSKCSNITNSNKQIKQEYIFLNAHKQFQLDTIHSLESDLSNIIELVQHLKSLDTITLPVSMENINKLQQLIKLHDLATIDIKKIINISNKIQKFRLINNTIFNLIDSIIPYITHLIHIDKIEQNILADKNIDSSDSCSKIFDWKHDIPLQFDAQIINYVLDSDLNDKFDLTKLETLTIQMKELCNMSNNILNTLEMYINNAVNHRNSIATRLRIANNIPIN
jgi:hypothetical protein